MDTHALPQPARDRQDELTPPPGGLHFASLGHVSEPAVAAADAAARHWLGHDPAPVRTGSDAHRRLACQMFRETFNPYKPSVIDWPALSPEARDRLVNLPIWDIAVYTEGKARLRMLSYAHSLADPEWREAIELNGWEEGRHKTVLSNLVQAYGIAVQPEPEYIRPRDPQWAYLRTGFSECIDSFFAFGLFALAKRSGFFPPELVETFEPVIQEECRHILLFANWVAWTRANTPFWRRPWFEARVAAAWMVLAWDRLDLARGMDKGAAAPAQENNFTMTGGKAVSGLDVGVANLLRLCLTENDRRFAGYDSRLCRPTTMPGLVRFALRFMRKTPLTSRAT